MKKIIKSIFLALVMVLLFACEGNKYNKKSVKVYSLFDASSFELNVKNADLGDSRKYSAWFLCKKNINEIAEQSEYVEKSDDYIRFYSCQNYYYLMLEKEIDGEYQYRLISEYSTIMNLDDKDSYKVPFPRNCGALIDLENSISDEDYNYFLEYYNKIGFDAKNDEISISIKSEKGKKGVLIIKKGDTIRLEG